MTRAVYTALLASLFGQWLLSSPAHAGVTFTLNYVFVEREVSPKQEVHRLATSVVIRLRKDNTIVLRDRNGTDHTIPIGKSDSFLSRGYEDGTVATHVKNGRLQLRYNHPGRIITVSITSTGPNSCSASQTYAKAPGHPYFEAFRLTNGEKMFSSEEHVEELACLAVETPD